MALTFRTRLVLWHVFALGSLLVLTAAGLIYFFERENQGKSNTFLYFIVIFVVLILVILNAAITYFLASRAIRPIEKVTAAAESITARNLNLKEKLPEPVTRDEIGRLTLVFNDMVSRLNATFRAQRRFTARVAHELRTPLTIIKGENQVLLNRPRTTEEYETQLRSSLEEVEKMERTIDDLIMFARYEAGETEMPLRLLRLDTLVDNVIKDLRPVAREAGITFVIETGEPSLVFGEEQALTRLICKFTENALSYTPDGGRVIVRVYNLHKIAVLSVEDTGVGIAPEDLPHIFERFFRASSTRQMRPAGAGIGLALADVIARLHKAEITVESAIGKGTKFVIKFPLVD